MISIRSVVLSGSIAACALGCAGTTAATSEQAARQEEAITEDGHKYSIHVHVAPTNPHHFRWAEGLAHDGTRHEIQTDWKYVSYLEDGHSATPFLRKYIVSRVSFAENEQKKAILSVAMAPAAGIVIMRVHVPHHTYTCTIDGRGQTLSTINAADVAFSEFQDGVAVESSHHSYGDELQKGLCATKFDAALASAGTAISYWVPTAQAWNNHYRGETPFPSADPPSSTPLPAPPTDPSEMGRRPAAMRPFDPCSGKTGSDRDVCDHEKAVAYGVFTGLAAVAVGALAGPAGMTVATLGRIGLAGFATGFLQQELKDSWDGIYNFLNGPSYDPGTPEKPGSRDPERGPGTGTQGANDINTHDPDHAPGNWWPEMDDGSADTSTADNGGIDGQGWGAGDLGGNWTNEPPGGSSPGGGTPAGSDQEFPVCAQTLTAGNVAAPSPQMYCN